MQERQNLPQDPEKKTRQSKALITRRVLDIQAIMIIMIIAIITINIINFLILPSLVLFIKVNSGKIFSHYSPKLKRIIVLVHTHEAISSTL